MVSMAPPVPFPVQMAPMALTAMRRANVSMGVCAMVWESAYALLGTRVLDVRPPAQIRPGAFAVPSTVPATTMPSATQ